MLFKFLAVVEIFDVSEAVELEGSWLYAKNILHQQFTNWVDAQLLHFLPGVDDILLLVSLNI